MLKRSLAAAAAATLTVVGSAAAAHSRDPRPPRRHRRPRQAAVPRGDAVLLPPRPARRVRARGRRQADPRRRACRGSRRHARSHHHLHRRGARLHRGRAARLSARRARQPRQRPQDAHGLAARADPHDRRGARAGPPHRGGVNLEIKNVPTDPDWDPTPAYANRVMDVVVEAGLARSQLLIQSFIPGNLEVAKSRLPRVKTSLLALAATPEALEFARSSGYTGSRRSGRSRRPSRATPTGPGGSSLPTRSTRAPRRAPRSAPVWTRSSPTTRGRPRTRSACAR